MKQGYIQFMRENAPFLATGALLSFLSSFGQTFFIAVFAGDIRAEFNLSHGDWGLLYMIGTAASAVAMVFAGGLADKLRVRTLGVSVAVLLAAACVTMAFNTITLILPFVIFALRFAGQGMMTHTAVVAMARWFVATRGKALAIAGLGFMLAEATLPLTFVWLKTLADWRMLWIGAAVFVLAMIPVLIRLLRLERTPQSAIQENASPGMKDHHWTRQDALRHPLFWSLTPAMMFFPAFATAFWFHQVHFAEIKGYSHLALVAVFPIGTAVLAMSTIAYGWMIDRVGAKTLLPFYLLPLVAAFVLHWSADSLAWTALAVCLMGLAGGGQSTVLMAVWSEFYGTRNIGSIKAAAAAVMVLGSAIGPGLSGWLIDIGVGFEQQMLGYAASFIFASLVMIVPLRRASANLPHPA
ncbi:MFS family permease [Loktanella ponticola]|uniref:MFS family permease n=1 Tax=Yoonia ponticola TaxID=1524255 RepID=A0A7W9BIQ7_9RHOB|nr:MFS transporter [Yoonia ponticola]MBB5721302.1 MFS family permease [Yoonia ponticola]